MRHCESPFRLRLENIWRVMRAPCSPGWGIVARLFAVLGGWGDDYMWREVRAGRVEDDAAAVALVVS